MVFEIQFLLSVSTLTDFTVQHMSKLSCVSNLSLKYHFWPKQCSILLFLVEDSNSITVVLIDMFIFGQDSIKARELSINCNSRVLIHICLSHTLKCIFLLLLVEDT